MNQNRISFSEKQLNLINDKLPATVAVVSPDKSPHVTPVWITEYNGRIYFTSETTRVKYRYLEKNNSIAINVTHPTGNAYVSVNGKANFIKKPELDKSLDIITKLAKTYYSTQEEIEKFIKFVFESETRILVEVVPIKVY